MKTMQAVWLAAAAALAVAACPMSVQAGELDTVKASMAQRKSQIDGLKANGTVGENNKGYLTVLGQPGAADKAAIDAENADRAKVYAAIAGETGSTAADVGTRRAQKIAEIAPAGTKIQDAAGAWKTK